MYVFLLIVLRCYSSAQAEAFYNDDHKAMRSTLRKIIDTDINPHVNKWEAEESYPAREVFKKLADAGLLGDRRECHRFYKGYNN